MFVSNSNDNDPNQPISILIYNKIWVLKIKHRLQTGKQTKNISPHPQNLNPQTLPKFIVRETLIPKKAMTNPKTETASW